MTLEFWVLFVQIYLGVFLLVNFSERFKENHKIWFRILYGVALVGSVLSIGYAFYEKQLEDKKNSAFQQSTSSQLYGIDNGISSVDFKIEEMGREISTKKKSPFDHDYQLDIVLKLDDINRNINQISKTYRVDHILSYFEDLNKVPEYLNWEEWKDSEQRIYNKSIEYIKNDFIARGRAGAGEGIIKQLDHERQKILTARERQFIK